MRHVLFFSYLYRSFVCRDQIITYFLLNQFGLMRGESIQSIDVRCGKWFSYELLLKTWVFSTLDYVIALKLTKYLIIKSRLCTDICALLV